MRDSGKKDLIIIELNEFNIELLQAAVKTYPLPHLEKVLNFKRSSYKTNDRYNSGYLEPWVQWVSIHGGSPSSAHKIKHLGDVPHLKFKQCWQILDEENITTGIWGVMNGARLESKSNAFFLPDPWTFSEKAYPPSLNGLLDLPRYLSTNYQDFSIFKCLGHTIKLLYFVLFSGKALKVLTQCLKLPFSLLKNGKKHYVFISWFDKVSTILFSQYKKLYEPKVSILFLNSLAHLQHHHWKEGTHTVTKEIAHGLKSIDAILKILFKAFPDDSFVIHNGLSQMNTNHEKPWILYRQKNPKHFYHKIGLKPARVEQNMTHDGHLFFKKDSDCVNAFEALKNATVDGHTLFHVENYPQDPKKLFYRLDFTDDLPENATLRCMDKDFAFFKLFDKIVTRTGRHIPFGTVLSQDIQFHDHIFNHDFNQFIYHYFNPDKFKLKTHLIEDEQPMEETA